MSDFHDILFPPDISYGSSGGPKFKTSIWEADSGFEVRVDQWPTTRAEYDVSHGIKSNAQAEALTTFFMNRRGRAYSFRFKDFSDYSLENVTLGVGDYANRVFQLVKEYRNVSPAGKEYVLRRPIEKVEWNSEKGVQIDGSTLTKLTSAARYYRINYSTGKLTLNQPMWGGRYAATTPQQKVTWLPPIDPSYPTTGYSHGSLVRPTLFYASETGHAFVRGWASAAKGSFVLRRIHLPTAKEDARATHLTMQTPRNAPFDYILGVSPAGMVYLLADHTLVKVDGRTMQFVAEGESGTVWNRIVEAPISPGAVSLNDQYLLHANTFGYVLIYSTETLVQVADLGRYGGPSVWATYRGACPYKANGFAFVYGEATTMNGCGLRVWLPGSAWVAATWGATTAFPIGVYYDRKTEGVLVFWMGEEGPAEAVGAYGEDYWCGLFLPEEGRWAWTRRMPPSLRDHRVLSNGQAVLNGEFCWGRGTGAPFGNNMWRIDTATGVVTARRTAGEGGVYEVYDAERQLVGSFGGDAALVYSTDVDGVAFTPPEVLTLGRVEFHVCVRFDTDHLNMKHEFWTYRSWDSIPLVEVRDWSELEMD